MGGQAGGIPRVGMSSKKVTKEHMTVHVKQGVYHIQEQKYDGFNNTYFMQHCTSRALHADNSLPTVTAQYPKHGIPVNTRDLRQMVQLVDYIRAARTANVYGA